jgi:hypothetical protein
VRTEVRRRGMVVRVVVPVPAVEVEDGRRVAVAGVARLGEVERDDVLLRRQGGADALGAADAAEDAFVVVVAGFADAGSARVGGGGGEEADGYSDGDERTGHL